MKKYLFIILFISVYSIGQTSLERLEKSPRHHEWVEISNDYRTLQNFLVFPEIAEKATVVIVIHENRGLNDWARSLADQIAEEGYIAIAPDLLSGTGPNGGGTASFENSDEARTAIYGLNPDQVTSDLKAVINYSKNIPAGNGKVAVIGFCWGGSQSFRLATNSEEIEAAFVCYGTGPNEAEEIEKIKVPVYGFYGGNDNRVNATINKSQELMNTYNKTYVPVIYEGAGHGFFRAGEDPDASEANKKARTEGWQRLKTLLSKI
ncbi:MAG: dienelactone hydrolase family protein [Flavobacteriaceae bacterium]|nr:dienelactone hydrolase family protein [Flavobacteriaceae bacterium]